MRPQSKPTASASTSAPPFSSTRGYSNASSILVGRDLRTEVPMGLDPQYSRSPSVAAGTLNCTPDVPKLEAEVAKLSPHDALNVRRFLDDNRAKMEQFRPCLEQPVQWLEGRGALADS